MYLAPGLLSPGTRPSPLWCFRFEPRPWRPLTGWSLQPRWPGRGSTVAVGFDHARWKSRAGFRFSHFSLPPDLVDGSLPPPLIRTVDHIVVHEAGSVDHFRDHSYGSLTREQVSEGDNVKGSEMKLGLIPPNNKPPLKSWILNNDFKTRLHLFMTVTSTLFPLPISVAVDVQRPGHQDNYHRSNGLSLAIEIVVTQKLEFFFGHKKLLQR